MKNRNLPLIILFAATGAMNKLAELQQERAGKVTAQTGMIEDLKNTETREFTADQEKRFDGLTGEIEAIDKKIERQKTIDEAEKRSAALDGEPRNEPTKKEPKKGGEAGEKRSITGRASVLTALRSVTRNKPLEGAEKEMNELAIEENRNAGVETPDNSMLNIPMSMLRSDAQTVSEDGGDYGGQLVHDQAPRVQMSFSPSNFLSELGATRLRGLSGGNIPLPVMGDYDFAWLTETEKMDVQKKKFEGETLSPHRLGAAVEISNRLLLQSSVDVERMIRMRLDAGYQRAINAAAINGSGSGSEPKGILNTTGVQQSATVAAAVPNRAMAVELPALIEAANSTENSLGFLMSPQLKALLQNTKVDEGSGMFLMPTKDGLMGYKAASTTLVPKLASNQVLIFGDWSQLFVGEWGSLSVITDPYSASLSNSIRLVLNGHADVAIAQPEAFAVNKFLNGTV